MPSEALNEGEPGVSERLRVNFQSSGVLAHIFLLSFKILHCSVSLSLFGVSWGNVQSSQASSPCSNQLPQATDGFGIRLRSFTVDKERFPS